MGFFVGTWILNLTETAGTTNSQEGGGHFCSKNIEEKLLVI